MSAVKPMLEVPPGATPRAALFLSGSGSNAEQILQRLRAEAGQAPFEACALVTDAPETSRARELGRVYGLRVIENDIRAFYRGRGQTRVSIATAAGQQLREEWTDLLRTQLTECGVDFAVFAGFVPLTNLAGDLPCLNVHPGDLTYLKSGRRYLVGLHTVPIERAILEGLDYLRSSVILALPYSGQGDDMDNGPLLGVSAPVPIELQGTELAELEACVAARPDKRPKGGFQDRLEQLAELNQENLKKDGDWVVFPHVVFDFARGRFGLDGEGRLCYRIQKTWHPIQTVVYGRGEKEILFEE